MNILRNSLLLGLLVLTGCPNVTNPIDDDDSVPTELTVDISATLDGSPLLGADVELDGNSIGTTILDGYALESGSHTIDIAHTGSEYDAEAGNDVTVHHAGHLSHNFDSTATYDVPLWATISGNWRCENEYGYVDYDTDVYTDDEGHIHGLSLLGGNLIVNGHAFTYTSSGGNTSAGTISSGHRHVTGIYTFISSGGQEQVICSQH